jgi:hypothetical protein
MSMNTTRVTSIGAGLSSRGDAVAGPTPDAVQDAGEALIAATEALALAFAADPQTAHRTGLVIAWLESERVAVPAEVERVASPTTEVIRQAGELEAVAQLGWHCARLAVGDVTGRDVAILWRRATRARQKFLTAVLRAGAECTDG